MDSVTRFAVVLWPAGRRCGSRSNRCSRRGPASAWFEPLGGDMNTHRAMRFAVGVLIATVLFSAGLRAQTGTAVIVGTLTDPSGAALPGVKVTATNTDTGQSISTVSGASGDYRIPGLLPGPYEIHAE